MRKQIMAEMMEKVNQMTVAQMRKQASVHGIKNASKYKRVELAEKLADALTTEAIAEKAMEASKAAKRHKKATKSNADKRYKADKVSASEVAQMAGQLLTSGIDGVNLYDVNRKVLIEVMKQLHCKKWYRTYDKPTMVAKITEAMAA